MKLSRLAVVALFLLAALVPASLTAKVPRPATAKSQTGEWKSFIAIDAADGKVLLEDNADLVTPPASMTKLMTFAVLHDKLQSGAISLGTPVKIINADAKIGGTQVFLDPSETFPVEELIYAMMIQSANDAAHALARACAGSVEAFVQLMNAKARAIGMAHTTFQSPHGLPPASRRIADGDLTTARDYALLCRYLLTKTDVLKYTSTKERDFGPNRPKGPQHMINHNKLLGRVEGVDGLKTGYTQGAGYCLSATALRNGHRVIVVIMGAFGTGGRIDLGVSRDRKTIEILEHSFAMFATTGGPVFTGATAPKPSPIFASPATTTETAANTGDGLPTVKFMPLRK